RRDARAAAAGLPFGTRLFDPCAGHAFLLIGARALAVDVAVLAHAAGSAAAAARVARAGVGGQAAATRAGGELTDARFIVHTRSVESRRVAGHAGGSGASDHGAHPGAIHG